MTSHEIFTGKEFKLNPGYYRDGDFIFPTDFLHYLKNYDIGVPYSGTYTEILNSEKDIYDGCNMCNFEPLKSRKNPDKNARFANLITIRIAPFAAIWFTCPKKRTRRKTADAGK